ERSERGDDETAPAVEEAEAEEEHLHELPGRPEQELRRDEALPARELLAGRDRGEEVDRLRHVMAHVSVGEMLEVRTERSHRALHLDVVVGVHPAPLAAAAVEEADLRVGV